MYKCEICGFTSQPNMPTLKHTIFRCTGQIAREIKICYECKDDLESGISLGIMLQEHKRDSDDMVSIPPKRTIKNDASTVVVEKEDLIKIIPKKSTGTNKKPNKAGQNQKPNSVKKSNKSRLKTDQQP